MSKLDELKKRLKPGQVYRRADLAKWSNAVDRHLQQLVKAKVLEKLSGGLYYCPKYHGSTRVPPNIHELVEAFLKDHRFLITSRDAYHALGVGIEKIYGDTVVYNHKRHGHFKLDGQMFDFRVKPYFPSMASKEFLLVDLVDNIELLAEDRNELLEQVRKKARRMNARNLGKAVLTYGGVKARNFFEEALGTLQGH